MRTIALILGLVVGLVFAEDLQITYADRKIDISTQLVKASVTLTVQNNGKSDLAKFTFLLTEEEAEHLSHISAYSEKKDAVITASSSSPQGFTAYRVDLSKKVSAGASRVVTVDYILSQALLPFPSKITQDETQFVIYTGNGYVSSEYPINNQKTTVQFGSGKLQTFTPVQPSKQLGEKVVYGSYVDVAALSKKEVKVHYENVAPFMVATRVDRLIEISHWGNIAVEESIEIVHKGAQLAGPFSRLDFQLDRRGNKQPCVKQYKTVLPASARDIYYRDEIGNISTSSVRVRSDSVEVDIRPRYPLFGGWKTSYVIGYNVPSYEYLFSEGSQFALKMRLLDHIYDDVIVEELTTRIILPELAAEVELSAPYPVDRLKDEKKATYLDTTGRPVIVIHKDNLVDAHIQTFTLSYRWKRQYLVREPLLASAFFFILFLSVVIYTRFDFAIAKDAGAEARMGLAAKLDILHSLQARRNALHDSLVEAVAKYKENRNIDVISNIQARLSTERAELAEKMTAVLAEIKTLSPAAYLRVHELEKVEKALVEGEKAYVEVAAKTDTKNAVEDRHWAAKLADAKAKANALLKD